jgi:hypothetical protein
MGWMDSLFGGKKPPPPRTLDPQNLLEEVLRDVCRGEEKQELFIRTLLASKLFVPSLVEPQKVDDGTTFRPVITETPDGPMLVAYTAPTRAPHDGAASESQAALYVDSRWLLMTIPPDIGMVINPGWDVAISMPAKGLVQFKKDYGLADVADPGAVR